MGGHSKLFPPSSAKSWLACPAWLSSDGTNFSARFGTLCHDLADEWLRQGKKPWAVPPEMVPLVEGYVEYCQNALEWADQWFTEKKVKIKLTRSFGTSDFAALTDDVLEVVDLKTGKSSVSANSDQLRIYALGALDYFEARNKVKTIRLCIWQRGKLRTHEMATDELLDWEKEQKPKVKLRRKVLKIPTLTLEHVEKGNHCFFCSRKQTCPAWMGDAIDDFEDF